MFEKELINKKTNGELYYELASLSSFKDASGSISNFVAIKEDITERKRMEERLQFLASIVESSDDAIIGETLDGFITSWNWGAEKIYGYTSEEINGRHFSTLIPPDHLGEVMQIITKIKSGGHVNSLETVRMTKAGRQIHVSLTFSPIIDSTGKVTGVSVIAHDITERKKAEKALQESEERLRRAHDELEMRVAERTAQLEKKQKELEMQNRKLREMHQELETSLDRYWDLYNFAPLSYVTLDDKGVIQDVNLTGARLLGIDRNHLIGMPFICCVNSGDTQTFLNHIQRHNHTEEEVVSELGITIQGGKTLQAQLYSVPVQYATGQTVYRTAITDITKRKLTEEKLLRLNRLYAVLCETNQAIVRSVDRESLFHEICRVTVEHGGFQLAWIGLLDEESDVIKPVTWSGTNEGFIDDIRIPAEEEPKSARPVGSAVREGTIVISNDLINDTRAVPWQKEAMKRGFNSSASISFKLNGKDVGVLNIYSDEKDFFSWQFVELLQQMATDITFALDNIDREARRRKAEHSLREETAERLRAMEALRKKDQLLMQQNRQAAMGEMIGNIAHQWRQPLNTLGLMLQQMQVFYDVGKFSKDYFDDSVKKSMEIIRHMSQTIDDFRNFFKPDKEYVEFEVLEVVTKTLSLIEGSFNDQRIKIEVNLLDDPIINGHPNEYAQVLLNILVNARDALSEAKVADPRVTITICRENDKAVVTINDNAGGVSEDIMDKIFDPYFTTKGPDKGTGVGLFMSKTIIEKNMKGRLTARNFDGGAEFRIEV